jgi:hypothetical protein
MMRKRTDRVTMIRGRMLAAVALTVAAASLSMAASALATPKGAFAVFADCPLKSTGVVACIYANTESGSFTVGKKTVPIEKSIVLQGGLKEGGSTGVEFVAAADGKTLAKVPQKVPGGLSGLVNCTEIKGSGLLEKLERGTCEGIFENGLTGVTATTELAAPASSIGISLEALFSANGTALSLPVKVHLENPLLGSSCYVGSNSAPIVIELTTGTTKPPPPNKPITGSVGTFEVLEEGELLRFSKNSLVNNSFAAPKTNGCGGLFEFLIGPLINSQLGVPAAAGTNTAILNGTLENAGVEQVKKHE